MRPYRKAGAAGLARVTLWAAIAVVGLGGAAFSGCDLTDGDDDDSVTTTPATTGTETTGATGQSDKSGGGPVGGDQTPETPEDTGPVVPESGGVGADDYDPEADSPENDLPPPPGSPQEKFEQACDENPGLCD